MDDQTQYIALRGPDYEMHIVERLARMETKLDGIKEDLIAHERRIAGLEGAVPSADHEARIRKLERALWMVAGFAAAGGGTLGAFIQHVAGG